MIGQGYVCSRSFGRWTHVFFSHQTMQQLFEAIEDFILNDLDEDIEDACESDHDSYPVLLYLKQCLSSWLILIEASADSVDEEWLDSILNKMIADLDPLTHFDHSVDLTVPYEFIQEFSTQIGKQFDSEDDSDFVPPEEEEDEEEESPSEPSSPSLE